MRSLFVPVLSLLWLGFYGYWLWGARKLARALSRAGVWADWLHVGAVAAGLVLILATCVAPRPLSETLVHQPHWLRGLALGGAVAGLAFAWWAHIVLGRWWRGVAAAAPELRLAPDGPYGVVRHPVYAGIVMAAATSALAINTIGAALGLVAIITTYVLRVGREDRRLAELLGPAYAAYRSRVAAIFPGLY